MSDPLSVIVLTPLGPGIVQSAFGDRSRFLELVELLDPGEDVHGDSAGHDLERDDRGEDGHPRDFVLLEPAVQFRAATLLFHLLGGNELLVRPPGPNSGIGLVNLLVAALVDRLVVVREVLRPGPSAAVQPFLDNVPRSLVKFAPSRFNDVFKLDADDVQVDDPDELGYDGGDDCQEEESNDTETRRCPQPNRSSRRRTR